MILSYIVEADQRWPCKATQGQSQSHEAKASVKAIEAKAKKLVLRPRPNIPGHSPSRGRSAISEPLVFVLA